MSFESRTYSVVTGSDVDRDGMVLELNDTALSEGCTVRNARCPRSFMRALRQNVKRWTSRRTYRDRIPRHLATHKGPHETRSHQFGLDL